jgi:hypothetical protein
MTPAELGEEAFVESEDHGLLSWTLTARYGMPIFQHSSY